MTPKEFQKLSEKINTRCRRCGNANCICKETEQNKARELLKWIHRNNTVPLKDMFKMYKPESKLVIASLDGGWVNGLKLQRKIEELFGV